MKNTDPDVLVRRFVDGELSDAEVREALHRIADDPEARDLLQFELEMTQNLAASRSVAPSADFADQTMAEIEASSADVTMSIWNRLEQWWEATTTPVSLELRPLSALVAVLLMAGVFTWVVWPSRYVGSSAQVVATNQADTDSAVRQASASTGETMWIRFMYANSTADSVAVAGDFNQWTPVSLSPRTVNGQTVWTGLVPVPPGEHEYQFLINGERWVPDPLAPTTRSDGFGAKNAVLTL